jgi:GH24 family phage-related lysozyme (muramidase)
MNWYKTQLQKEAIGKKELLWGLGLGGAAIAPFVYNDLKEDSKNNIQNKPATVQEYKLPDDFKKQVELNNQNLEPVKKVEVDKKQNNYYETAKNLLERHEGKRNKMYLDTKGIPTVGIGFNLKRNDAREIIESLGLNYNDVLSGRQSLTDQQVYRIFDVNFKEAEQICRNIFPTFNNQPDSVKIVLVNMAFNLGEPRFRGFKKFISAIENKEYQKAAEEMKNSRWYGQVGNRSRELVNIMRNNNE